MDDYSVLVQARAPQGAGPALADLDDHLDDFTDLIDACHGTAGVTDGGWEARVSIDAGTPEAAATRGAAFVRECATKAGLPDWPLVHLQAVRGDVLDAEHAHPNKPDLVSGPEAAAILHVTRQRLHQLHNDHPDFPEPLYHLKVGPLWLRSAIEAFDRRWERKPGRPAKEPAAS
jgi:hypothetical protein